MMESPNPPSHSSPPESALPTWLGPAICGAIIAVYYAVIGGFGVIGNRSPLYWLQSAWNKETRYEHGFMVPIIMVGLVAWQWKNLVRLAKEGKSHWLGLPMLLLGILFFVASHRCGQPRLAIAGLPMILWGSSLYLWGWQLSRLLFFPFFFLWLAVPVPEFQQATVKLQMLSTQLSQWGSELFGVKVHVSGTKIESASKLWEPLEIDEGCGGIRSLMALIMISTVWAYLAKVSLWKKGILLLAAFPLAIFGNMLRLTSIFVIAEYGNPDFARHTWHDWSGLVIFYPISLCLLLLVHSILEQGLPWKKPKKKAVRHVVGRKSGDKDSDVEPRIVHERGDVTSAPTTVP
ncbi:exosortase/archaeosortase family protein [Haloferula sp. BvORR071]|uniref:exosortase/archaeosortase family protein n=1 Tax=Haloferula sp. BvORR071 TaxID=1396141 RepID=UPI0005568B05|nr:exosortase/archaeosortase family protein [Haloferula sp. BvORR071]